MRYYMSLADLPAYFAASPTKGFPESQKVYHIIILLVCVAILIASLLFHVNEAELYLFGFKWPVHCFLYETFGVKCALCGLTRSVCSFAQGNFLTSLRFHLVGPAIFAFICLQVPYRIWVLVMRPRQPNKKIMKIGMGISVLIIVALLVNWLVYLGGLVL
jgi:hypothetical protein